MNRKNDNLFFDDSATRLDNNISRLVKLADDSNKPGKTFTNSLIDGALRELGRVSVGAKREQEHAIVRISWMNRAVGWAAMFAAACGTSLAVILSTLFSINTFLAVIVSFTMFANWLIYFGGLIL